MFSKTLTNKWRVFLEKKCGQPNLSDFEIFDIASKITEYFKLLIEFNKNETPTKQ